MLREAKEREANVLELRAQEAKIRSQLQFEARKDLPGAIEKLKGTIADDEATLERKLARQAELEKEAEALRSQARDRAEIAPRSRRDQEKEAAWTTFLIWQVAELESEARAARDEADAKGAEVKAAKKSLRACADELGRRQAGVRAQCRPPSSYRIWTTFLISCLDHLPYLAGDASRGRPRSAALAASAHIPAREARGGPAAVVVAVLRLFSRWRRLSCCAAVVERTPLLPR